MEIEGISMPWNPKKKIHRTLGSAHHLDESSLPAT